MPETPPTPHYSVYMVRLWPWQDPVVEGTWMERCQEITANASVSIYEVMCKFVCVCLASVCRNVCVCVYPRGLQ